MRKLLKSLSAIRKIQSRVDDIHDAVAGADVDEDAVAGSRAWNDGQRKIMAALGDQGEAVREVTHFAFPLAGSQPKAIARDAIAWLDGRFEDTEEMENLLYFHSSEVASAAFDMTTLRMAQDLEQVGWEYGGWEAPILEDKESQ